MIMSARRPGAASLLHVNVISFFGREAEVRAPDASEREVQVIWVLARMNIIPVNTLLYPFFTRPHRLQQ